MPPRTRTAKSTKPLKENIGIVVKTKQKCDSKISKPPRKVLGDKTNSASDDNASFEVSNDTKKNVKVPTEKIKIAKFDQENLGLGKPIRDRRIPRRFEEKQMIRNLSKSKDTEPIQTGNLKLNHETKSEGIINDTVSVSKTDHVEKSPFKMPQKVAEVSLVANRPRRVSRLPSRFEDHSISPSKFIPVQPCHASTPLVQKTAKTSDKKKKMDDNKITKNKKEDKTTPQLVQSKIIPTKNSLTKTTADTNNNAKARTLRPRQVVNVKETPLKNNITKQNLTKNDFFAKVKSPAKKDISKAKQSPVKLPSPVKHSYLNLVDKNLSSQTKSPIKVPSPVKKSTLRSAKKDLSFKLLEDNNRKENQDVYEFTFDPDEEPAPQKKKRKAVKKKPTKPKPKTVTFKCNYEQNVNKALSILKTAVSKKPAEVKVMMQTSKPVDSLENNLKNTRAPEHESENMTSEPRIIPQVQRNIASKIIISNSFPKQTATASSSNFVNDRPQIQENILLNKNDVHYSQQNVLVNNGSNPESSKSIRVEDIEADFDTYPQHDIDYSPVNSPSRPKTPEAQISKISDIHDPNDPLHLRENISFDPNPIASSSMNTSVRHPHASPWRVEFESLPIHWHVNTYVKPNMTPAVECSFVNFEDKNKKKHVPETNDPLPEIVQNDQKNLVQTSIFSFIKEVVEKSSSKKNRGRSVTPISASLFNDNVSTKSTNDSDRVNKTTRQLFTPKKNLAKTTSDTSNADKSKDVSNDKEDSKDSSSGYKRKNNEKPNTGAPKTPRKEKDEKYFGFDDSENLDQENVSPRKDFGRKKSLRPRAKAVLKEINEQSGPTRAVIPLAAKTARREEAERLYDEMKSATDAPVFSAKETAIVGAANVVEPVNEFNEDSQTSVHLFEDIDIVHHLKPQRKSYGKAKKVTFLRNGSTDSDTQDSDLRPEPTDSDEEDDLKDLTFDPGMPLEEEIKKTKKKQSKKQKMTKKEEEEAEAWAAGFNSMCEDVEEFPLVIE